MTTQTKRGFGLLLRVVFATFLGIVLGGILPAFAQPHFSPEEDFFKVEWIVADGDRIDPIVTGMTLSAQDHEKWEKRYDRFLECGLCGEGQLMPNSLPEAWTR